MTDDGVADRRLVGNLVLERVGLGGTDERDFHDLTVGINQRNGGTDGDGQIARGGSNLSVGEDGLDLGNTSGVLGLLVLSGVVLGVLRKVAERAGFLDVLDDLLGVIASRQASSSTSFWRPSAVSTIWLASIRISPQL